MLRGNIYNILMGSEKSLLNSKRKKKEMCSSLQAGSDYFPQIFNPM